MRKKKSAGKKRTDLPPSATIKISKKYPYPDDEVDVSPDAGMVHFQSTDPTDYRLRLWRTGTDPSEGIDILLRAGKTVTVVIRLDDEFYYDILGVRKVLAKAAYGPIKN